MTDRPDIPEEGKALADLLLHDDRNEIICLGTDALAEAEAALRKQGAEEAEAKLKALADIAQSVAGNLVNGADRRKMADELLDANAVRKRLAEIAEEDQEWAKLEAERDQALAKGAEGERARLRGVIEEMKGYSPDERYPGTMRDDDGGCWIRDHEVLAALDQEGDDA